MGLPTELPSASGSLEWGNAVHGSSAFLQAVEAVSARPPSHTTSGAQNQAHAYGGSYCGPENANSHYYGYQQAVGAAGLLTPQQQLPSCASPQDPQRHHHHHHHHHHHYQAQQQHTWQAYHAHSAVSPSCAIGVVTALPHEGSAVSSPGTADGWQGWTSYSGTRTAAGASSAHHASSPHYQQPACTSSEPGTRPGVEGMPGHQDRVQAGSGNEDQVVFGLGQTHGSGGAGQEAYDPFADADVGSSRSAHGGTAAGPAGPSDPHRASGTAQPGRAAGPHVAAAASTAAGEAGEQAPQVVVVWDLDETLIVFNSLLSGAYERATAAAAAAASVACGQGAIAGAPSGAPGCGAGSRPAAEAFAAAAADAASLAAGAAAAGAAAAGAGAAPTLLPRRAELCGQRLAEFVFDFCDNHMSFRSLDNVDPVSFVDFWAAAAAADGVPSGDEADALAAVAAAKAGAAAAEVACATCAASAASASAAGHAAPQAFAGTSSIGSPPQMHPSGLRRATLQRIASVYGSGAAGLPAIMGTTDHGALSAVLADVEALTGGWVAAARRLLADVARGAAAAAATTAGTGNMAAEGPSGSRSSGSEAVPSSGGGDGGGSGFAACGAEGPGGRVRVRHVLVSAGHLVATLGKLLLWGLDQHFDIMDVYSASGCPKLPIFRHIAARFAPGTAFVAVGDGPEEQRAAAALGWGFVRVALGPGAQPRHAHGMAPATSPLAVGSAGTTMAAAAGVAVAAAAAAGRRVMEIRAEEVLRAAVVVDKGG